MSRVLLSLTKRLICVILKDSYPSQCHAIKIHVSSPITAASGLNFCSLALSVWLVSRYVFLTVTFTERLSIVIPLVITLLLWQFSKSVGAPFHQKLAQYH